MTCYQEITCPACGSNLIMKSGRSAAGTQRYRCHNPECKTKTFMMDYRYKACEPGIKEQVVDMSINGSITPMIGALMNVTLKSISIRWVSAIPKRLNVKI